MKKKILGKEPALIIGGIAAALSIAGTLVAGGGFDDGVQLAEVVAIGAPVVGVWGIRVTVDSPATVERKVAEAKRRR